MKIIYILLLLLLFPNYGFAQNSFSTYIDLNSAGADWENPEFHIIRFTGDENGNMYILGTLFGNITGYNAFGSPSGIIKLDSAGSFQNFRIFGIEANSYTIYYGPIIKNHIVAVIGRNLTPFSSEDNYLFVLDYENNSIWCRMISDYSVFTSGGGTMFGANNQIVYSQFATEPVNEGHAEKLGIASADITTGQVLWNRHYETTTHTWYGYSSANYTTTNNQDISILGGGSTGNGTQLGNFILQLSPEGEVIKSYGFVFPGPYALYQFHVHEYDSAGNVILAGRHNEVLADGSIKRSGIIAKYDPDFNLVWAKILAADFFTHYKISIQVLPTDEIDFSYSTEGEFPVIIGRLNKDGVLEQYQGFAARSPLIYTASDKSLFILSGTPSDLVSPDGHGALLIKTDPNGNVEGCPQYPACLELIDFDLQLEPWDWTYEDVAPLPMVEPDTVSLDLSTFPFCYSPPSPLPDFVLPDSICHGECVMPGDLKNQLANHSEFQITGPGLDSVIIDTTFNFCFTVPGTYTISQEVWVLGCSDFYSRELVVLPDLEIALDADSLVCEDLPFALSIQSNRPVVEYLWSDGSTDSFLSVNEDGEYWLTGSDGYCSDSVGIALELLALQLTEPVFILPADTTICANNLPFALEISGAYSEEFYNIETASAAQPFMLNEAGSYHFQTQVNGCTFDTVYHLEVSPCLADVFVPNIFTPNDDGINDWLEVYGSDIRVLQFTVFDRWGGVVFEHQGASLARWDGTQGGQPVNPGVFVVFLKYANVVSGTMYEFRQSVTLIR